MNRPTASDPDRPLYQATALSPDELIISSPLKLIVLMGRTPSGATTRSATSSYRRLPVTRPTIGG